MSMTPAMESIFANAQQNAASLIETATLAIHSKVNTIEEAEQMIQELSSEAVKYNELLTTIMNAMRQVESGDMQKEEAAGIIAPAVKELKDKCTALKIANAEAPGDDITEDEIAILRELIIGAKAAAEDRERVDSVGRHHLCRTFRAASAHKKNIHTNLSPRRRVHGSAAVHRGVDSIGMVLP